MKSAELLGLRQRLVLPGEKITDSGLARPKQTLVFTMHDFAAGGLIAGSLAKARERASGFSPASNFAYSSAVSSRKRNRC